MATRAARASGGASKCVMAKETGGFSSTMPHTLELIRHAMLLYKLMALCCCKRHTAGEGQARPRNWRHWLCSCSVMCKLPVAQSLQHSSTNGTWVNWSAENFSWIHRLREMKPDLLDAAECCKIRGAIQAQSGRVRSKETSESRWSLTVVPVKPPCSLSAQPSLPKTASAMAEIIVPRRLRFALAGC
jgi:hypothetical protein